jgi:DnaB-like helicase C terminal domain
MDPDEEECALYRMQAIAQDANVHAMLIHQQRLKDIEGRTDVRPTREGLKGSGAWVEMPDTIIGTHRPALWKAVDDVTVELLVLKQRHGVWPLAVECDWSPETGLICNGRTVEYARPGQTTEVDSFLNEAAPAGKGRRYAKHK